MSTQMPFMDVETVEGAKVVTFSRPDVTDAAFIENVGDEIYRIIKGLDRPRVVIDFDNVERLSSAALGMVVALKKVLEKQRGQLRLANVGPNVYDIFRITGVDAQIRICTTTPEALQSFT